MTSATDNRTTELTATERLRALLDERGVEYETADGWWTSWDTAGASYVGAVVYCEDLGSGLEIRWHTITPEQAIAATLGNDDDYERKMDALLCRLTNGKWSKSRAYDLDFMEQCINEEFETLYAEELADAELGNGTLTAEQVREAIEQHSMWVIGNNRCFHGGAYEEIADELNVCIERTCRNVCKEWEKTSFAHAVTSFCCSECGAHYVDCEGYYAGLADADEEQIRTNYCPNCGKRVI